jgi:hypothetical protein
MDQLLLVVILLTIYFVGFASGFGTRSIISQYRRDKALRASEARLGRRAGAEGEPKHDGKQTSMNLLAALLLSLLFPA